MLLSGSRLAAHCIECQVFPMGMDSGDALAHQQVALNLVFSHSSHLPPHFYPTPPLKPQLHRSTWPALDATLPNFCLHRYLSFIPKLGPAQRNTNESQTCRWLRLSSWPADVHWPAINRFKQTSAHTIWPMDSLVKPYGPFTSNSRRWSSKSWTRSNIGGRTK